MIDFLKIFCNSYHDSQLYVNFFEIDKIRGKNS